MVTCPSPNKNYCRCVTQFGKILRVRNPGANKQSIAQSSWFAWTKSMQTATSTNFITSYYNKEVKRIM